MTFASIRPVLRRLARTPGFTVVSILTLGLGIAGTTTAFSVINAVLLRPLPYHDPERLVQLWHTAPGLGIPQIEQSDASYIQYVDKTSRSFASLASYRSSSASLTGSEEPERVVSAEITASLIPTLGVTPMLGRNFTLEEDRPGAGPVVILSHALWQRRYGANRAIIGTAIQVDGSAREVVGVMPASFRFPDETTELWTPMAIDRSLLNTGNFNRNAIARLRPGVTIAAAEAEMQPVLHRLPDDVPGLMTRRIFDQAKISAVVHSLREDVIGDIRPILFTVLGTVAFVLLIACANVANLFLVRAEARAKEVAVRSALGATRRSIAGLYVGESLVLSTAGGILGVALAYGALGSLLRLAPAGLPRASEISIDLASLGVAAGIAIITGLFFSAVPFIRAGRAELTPMLRDGSRGSTSGRERQRVRNAFVIVQVALALVLLVGSGLLARSFQRMRAVDPGFSAGGVLTLRVTLPASTYPSVGDITRFYHQLTTRLATIPGVEAVGATSKLPLVPIGVSNNGLWIEDRPSNDELPAVHPTANVSQDYFASMRIPILAGRTFRDDGSDRATREMVVAQSLAKKLWPNESALGKRIKTGGPRAPWSTIVGVVGDVHDAALTEPADQFVYQPMVSIIEPTPGQPDSIFTENAMALTIRTRGGDATAVLPAVRREIWAMDSSLPLVNVRAMSDVVGAAMARTTFTLIMIGAAAGVALLLGAIGIYGVISYMVSLRTREIGVRMALGAQATEVRGMVVRQGLTLAAVGVVIGLAGALALSRLVRSLLFGIAPHDPVTLASVTLGLLGIAAVASWIPATRAGRIEPTSALRADG